MGGLTTDAGCEPAPIARRAILLAAPAMVLARAVAAAAPQFPIDFRMIIAGPAGGALARWGGLLATALRGETAAMPHEMVGGEDGVTGANQFATRTSPDGMTALLAPGAAALARLSGDPRAQFDAAGWLAVMAGVSPGVCVSRIEIDTARRGTVLRVAASGPAGPEMALLLAAELLGLKLEPVFGLAQRDSAARALTSGAVDAVLVRGPDSASHIAQLAAAGMPARFTLGAPGEKGWQRDPGLPSLPALPELLAGHDVSAEMAAAWAAVAMAGQLEFGLLLPAMSPAPMVAQWRSAGDGSVAALRDAVADVRILNAAQTPPVTKALMPDAPATLALRAWLADRFKWQPA